MKCDRGSSLLCLDWREICDGKIDCLDGGEDEKHCHELYMNECAENEYQCHNGMCINEVFLIEPGGNRDFDYECLDRSDQNNHGPCYFLIAGDLSIQCEDTTATFLNEFTCSDNVYISGPMPQKKNQCSTNRDRIFNYKFEWHSEDEKRFSRCFKIAVCASNIFSTSDHGYYCKILCGNKQECKIKLTYCPSYFFAPDFPVWDGHIRLGYFSNRTFENNDVLMPHFFCFDKNKCSFFILTFEIDNNTCVHTHTLNISRYKPLSEVFISCIDLDHNLNESSCNHSSMVSCPGTKKCIPKRHIMDGIPDCYDAFDESIASNSCILNDKYRFQCTLENKCLSSILVNDGKTHCTARDDEFENDLQAFNIQQLRFSAICDGITDWYSETNETDETHCEQWSCANQYTRCTKTWNCPKGIDEINCPFTSYCPRDHHPCLFPNTTIMGCLHLNRTSDGIVDCLGATDEREFCRLLYPGANFRRYRCWNDTACVHPNSYCDKCNEPSNINPLCYKSSNEIPSNIPAYYHRMDDIFLKIKLPFSPISSPQYPTNETLPSVDTDVQRKIYQIKELGNINRLTERQAWLCNRGILIFYGRNESEQCLCSPAYYGDRCQYQNQRISLTLRFLNEQLEKLHIIGIIITLVDDTGLIHSYEQFTYIPIRDCNTKFNTYLLYQDRPKNMTKNYTIHIDAYDKVNLTHLTSWRLPVKFLFMPVNRMSAQLIIPSQHRCHVLCNSKHVEEENNRYFGSCECELDKYKIISISQDKCDCSPDSICISIANNRSICLCPVTKNSPRCFLNSVCQDHMCMHGGTCVPHDDRISFTSFTCVCPTGFYGPICEEVDVKVDISFADVSIPQSILVHFITSIDYDRDSLLVVPIRATMFNKIGFDQNTVTFFMSLPFHVVFAEIDAKFYLTVLQHQYSPSENISTEIAQSQYCPHIRELFNKTILDYPILHRVKYYHLACMNHSDIGCFHDNETFMCLCTEDRLANCFHFNFNMSYNCMGSNDCENEGQCFQDNPQCPTKRICVCPECFYGTKCQFSTQQFGLSLDAILGYQIRPHVSISRQSAYIKGSIAITSIIFSFGITFGSLSSLTFQSKSCQQVGCGIYLFVSSITSILIVLFLNLKLWFLILTQSSIITSPSFLLVGCVSMEFILRFLLAMTDWFHACVAAERFATVYYGVKFSARKSKKMAKLLIILISLLTIVSFLHDPIHRRLIDDKEEQRTWCLSRLGANMEKFNSFINIFHFIAPFSVKFISTISMIVCVARGRALVKNQRSYITHLKEQFQKHKYMIISSTLMIILALPRLIISFSSGCMKSAREPLLFLVGYFVSYIPSILTFFIFVATSKIYANKFKQIIRQKWNAFRRRFTR